MTVDELRKALEAVPGDMTVVHSDETWLTIPEAAEVRRVFMYGEDKHSHLGDGNDWSDGSNFPGHGEYRDCFYIGY